MLEKSIDIDDKFRAGVRCTVWHGKMKDSGRKVAVFVRKSEQIYRGIYSNMTDANKNGVLSWMMDEYTAMKLKDHYGIEAVMMVERDTGDVWVSRMEDWADEDRLYVPDPLAKRPIGHGRVKLLTLPVQYMRHFPAEAQLLVGARRGRKSVSDN